MATARYAPTQVRSPISGRNPNGFPNRVPQVRIPPGAPCDVSRHRKLSELTGSDGFSFGVGGRGWAEGQVAEEFAGGGGDHADVQIVDEHDGVGSSDADVVESAVEVEGDDAGVVDAVVADPGVSVGGSGAMQVQREREAAPRRTPGWYRSRRRGHGAATRRLGL
jgi:hypothetical protein